MILAHAIASIVTPTGEIQVEAWRPPAIRDSWRAALRDVDLDGGPDGPAVDADWGEPGLTPAERVFGWNSFAVLAMLSGNPDGPVNAIAPWARAHCQLRYIAGTDVGDIVPALRRHLEAQGITRVRVEPPPCGNAGGFSASRTELDDPWAAWTREALARHAGQPPAVIPQMGGSICNEVFTDILGIPAIWIQHSYRGCSQHAPDEHVLLPLCREALGIMAASTGIWATRTWRVPDRALRPAPTGWRRAVDARQRRSTSRGMPPAGRRVSHMRGRGRKPAGSPNENRASSVARMICASIVAKPAPMQARGPAPNGR